MQVQKDGVESSSTALGHYIRGRRLGDSVAQDKR